MTNTKFSIFLTVHLRVILVSNQLDVLFLLQIVQLKSGPYFNMSNLFTNIYNMLYYTTNLYIQ